MNGPGSMTRYVAKARKATHDALRAELAPPVVSTWRLQFDALVEGAQSARNLAHERRREADLCGPDEVGWREHYEAEAARHFDRARWYLQQARIIRDNHL